MEKIESLFERLLFLSRWILAPFFVGLMVCIALLLGKFCAELWHLITHFISYGELQVILAVLTLVDIVLLANLLVIIAFSGYESFVSRFDIPDKTDKPTWLGKVGFATLKVKLLSSIIAIASIDLLKAFVNIGSSEAFKNPLSYDELKWKLFMYLSFILAGAVFGFMDYYAFNHNKDDNE